jgi:hypothetical protein
MECQFQRCQTWRITHIDGGVWLDAIYRVWFVKQTFHVKHFCPIWTRNLTRAKTAASLHLVRSKTWNVFIFVSYTSSDRDWAFWIGHELEDLGHRPHIYEWELSAAPILWLRWRRRRRRRPSALRRLGKIPEGTLFELGAQLGAMGRSDRPAEFSAACLHRAVNRRGSLLL